MLALRNAPARNHGTIVVDRIRALSVSLLDEFAIPFTFYDGSSGEPLGGWGEDGSPIEPRGEAPLDVLAIAASGRPHASARGERSFRLVLPIREPDGTTLIAIGDLPSLAGSPRGMRTEQARLQKWLGAVHSRLSFSGCSVVPRRDDQAHLLQLKSLLEALRELTDLLSGLGSIGDSDAEPRRILRRAAAVLRAESLIWVPSGEDEPVTVHGVHHLSAGRVRELTRCLASRPERDPAGYLILNEPPLDGSGDPYPGIFNLMALPGSDRVGEGWLMVVNKSESADPPNRPAGWDAHTAPPGRIEAFTAADRPAVVPFRRIDVALLKPFAALLGLRSRCSRRQSQVQDLFAGLVRSLTAAIDAKDTYTCGHSERVARVALELARELNLSESEQGDVYLAGLLHDIGKIGVPDSVLSKHGALTAEEFLQITEHVVIGGRILEGFTGISHLLPAILAHHERFDGAGYPHGLKGEAIPLAARILAVADCFDAMDTARPYRAPVPREEIEVTLDQGRNRQWDGKVVDAFLRARERIYAIHPRGVGESVWFALHAGERGYHPHFPGR